MDQQEMKKTNVLVFFFLMFFFTLEIIAWLYHIKILTINENILTGAFGKIFNTLLDNEIYIRAFFVVLMLGFFYMLPSFKFAKKLKEEDKLIYRVIALGTNSLFLVGVIHIMFYDMFIFPLIILANVFVSSKAMATLKGNLKEETMLTNVSSEKENDMSFSFLTDKGNLVVHSPQQGTWIEGGAGSGKSASLVEPHIKQSADKGFAGVIYDFKGNPPTLGLTAYNSLIHAKNTPVKFAIINFSLLKQSVRCNPISPRYLTSKNYARTAADTIMKNIKKEWIKSADFWADNAIGWFGAIIWFLKKYHPEYCTLPHCVVFALQNYSDGLNILNTDKEIKSMMMPISIAHEKNAEGQLAGAVASLQLPLSHLYNEELFWVMSKDDFDLDITNPSKPTMLVVCNDPALKQALSPGIALILSVCMQQMNQQGKQKSIFCVDELPTIYIKGLDELPATARSNKVCTILALQDYSQLERDYGKEQSKAIVSNLGNQFCGMTNNNETAERVAKSLGKIKKLKTSYSSSSNSLSESESLQSEEVLQARDIAGQKPGHFIGKIAAGDPPFFSAQFPYFDNKKIFPNYQDSIPDFAVTIKTGNDELDNKTFQNMIEMNFHRITTEVENLFAKYQLKTKPINKQ